MSVDATIFDSILHLCQKQHRRIVLGVLAEEQRPLTVEESAKAILKYNHQTPIAEASAEEITEISTTLHHIHLPKLAATGLIHYDVERELVEPAGKFEQVQPILSTILDADASLETPMAL